MSCDILLNLIDPDPNQARKVFDAGKLEELAQSMAASGQAVPVLLRPGQDGRYSLVHGERRWRAAQLLGWDTLRAEVQDLAPDQARWLALAENLQRDDLSPIEEAQAYQAALSGGLTQAALGQKLGKSQSYVAQKLRLLTLPRYVQEALASGKLSEGHGRQLLRLKEHFDQTVYARLAVTNRLSVQRLSLYVDSHLGKPGIDAAWRAETDRLRNDLDHAQSAEHISAVIRQAEALALEAGTYRLYAERAMGAIIIEAKRREKPI